MKQTSLCLSIVLNIILLRVVCITFVLLYVMGNREIHIVCPVVAFNLLQCSANEPPISLRYACNRMKKYTAC